MPRRFALLLAVAIVLFAVPSLYADIIHMKDGRQIEGKVTRKSAAEVTVSTQFGDITLRRSDIDRIEEKETPVDEYQRRYKDLEKDDINGLFDLAMWCKEEKLKKQYKSLLKQVLKKKPQHDGANEEMGNVQYEGKWFTKKGLLAYRKEQEKINRDLGLVLHEGKWMTPEEKMTAQGFVKVGEEWLTATEADKIESLNELEKVFGVPFTISNSPHFSLRSTDDEDYHKPALAMCEDLYAHFVETFQPGELEQLSIDKATTKIYILDNLQACNTWIDSEYYRRYKPPKNTIQVFKDATNFSYYFPFPVVVVSKGRHLKGGGDRDVSLHGFVAHHVGHVLIRRFKRGGKVPGWLESGMAAYLEGRGNGFRTLSISEYEGFDHIQKWALGYEDFRQWFSQIAENPEKMPSLTQLMDRPIEEMDSREICKAFSLCEFLIENHREAFVAFARRAFFPEKSTLVKPVDSFTDAFKTSMDAVDREWLAWAKTQSADRAPPTGLFGGGLGQGGR